MNWRREQHGERQESLMEQRRREDDAERLKYAVPDLTSLRIRMSEPRPDGHSSTNPYVKLVVIPSAPALFEIRCSEPKCDGIHDVTDAILDRLRRGHTTFEGDSPCGGVLGAAQAPCSRTLHYHVEAAFADSLPDTTQRR